MKKKNLDPVAIQIPGTETEIPKQDDFYKLPARFGAIPLDEAPLGYEIETRRHETKITKFEHAFPRILLPFQEVQWIEFGHGESFKKTDLFPKGANRLFFGDNLHIMRQLPSKSIDMMYFDPPFFSGRNYNLIFGDRNEVRSFTDIWESGMPGYLIWLNARLYEIVADFFCGGGTTPTVAQRLNRRWIACDQSRIAVAVTADRIARVVEDKIGKMFPVPDFTVEHWGIYEAPILEKLKKDEFREFVVKAFGGKAESISPSIHGTRYGVPLYVGEPSRSSRITKDDVAKFAQAIFKDRKTNFGAMLAWNFSADARKAAEILSARENKRIDFVRLNLVRLEDESFREHIITKHKDYGSLLSFIQPPEVRIAYERIGKLKYRFDVSESVSLNKDGLIANVQWDFDYQHRFSSTEGFAFLRDKKTGRPPLIVEYEFESAGKKKIACSVQDDQGGERTEIMEIRVE